MFIEKMLNYKRAIMQHTQKMPKDDADFINATLQFMMEDCAEMDNKYRLACNIIKAEVK